MRVLALTRYGSLGASSRVRMGQFVAPLAAAGVHVALRPLLPNAYVSGLYSTRSARPALVGMSYARRLALLAASGRPSLLWIEKEVLPFMPAWAERLLLSGRPYVVDYDDATFHSYDRHPRAAVRRLLGHKVDRLMRGARVVVAGNAYLAERARAAGAARVELLPSVVDTDRYAVAPEPAGPFTIGWIGSPGSERLLDVAADVLAGAVGDGARLVLVGASAAALPGVPHEAWKWAEATEAGALAAFHVGIMPLADTAWERGKCGFKIIQYMAAGRPVVASPVGVNVDIVREGVTGFLAADADAWRRSLACLRDDPALRRAMGAAGRARAEARYSLDVAAPRLAEILRTAAR